MPFTPDSQVKKSGFIPDATPADDTANTAQAALEGFGQTATMGYLPHLQAGASRGIDKLSEFLGIGPASEDAKLRQQGFNVPEHSYVQDRDANIERQAQQAQDSPIASGAGKLAGIAATSMLPGAAAKNAGFWATVGKQALQGAAQGALYNPGDTKGEINPLQLPARGENAAMGGVIGGATGALTKGLEKAADYGMQRAVGRNKYTPGVGNTLADEGVVGTKGMMRKQVEKKMGTRFQDMENAARTVKGVDTAPIAEGVEQLGNKLIPSGGMPAEVDLPKIEKVWDMAKDISSRGTESGPTALNRRAIAGGRAYRKDDALESLLGQASKAEQAGYSKALKEGYAAANPGLPNKMAEADNAYGALARANRSLNQEESIAKSLAGLAAKVGVGGAGGYLVGGKEGALIGGLAGTPAGMSILSQVANKTSKVSAPTLQAALRAILEKKREE